MMTQQVLANEPSPSSKRLVCLHAGVQAPLVVIGTDDMSLRDLNRLVPSTQAVDAGFLPI